MFNTLVNFMIFYPMNYWHMPLPMLGLKPNLGKHLL